MATAFYTVRADIFGNYVEFEVDFDVDAPLLGEEFDDRAYDDEVYREVMDNLYLEWDFDRLEED